MNSKGYLGNGFKFSKMGDLAGLVEYGGVKYLRDGFFIRPQSRSAISKKRRSP